METPLNEKDAAAIPNAVYVFLKKNTFLVHDKDVYSPPTLATMELKIYTSGEIEAYIKYRGGERKYGEYVQCASEASEDFSQHLQQSDAEYVLLGIPEDIGIQVALEKKGATSAWNATLDILLNTQHNTLNRGNKLYILGHLVLEEELAIFNTLNLSEKEDLKKAGELVACIDKEVTYIIYKIVACGKKPIVIGGGHNNAYGIIKGCALGFHKPVNVVNFDTRPDFYPKKRRHNGNGFSYAFSEGFLQKYYIFGLYE
ncbi:MAG: arginase family protein, partial [Bacteroidota bacterium]